MPIPHGLCLPQQEDCEFYLTAQRFVVLPMERQRMDSSNVYVPGCRLEVLVCGA